RNVLKKSVGGDGEREWSFGMFDCFGACRACLFLMLCPLLQFGRNASRLKYLDRRGLPHPEGRSCVRRSSACIVHTEHRGELRERYNIGGSGASEFCTGCFYMPCALAQESRELALEE
ncbi:PLAC8-domain-containing protein, partial [Clavulina sp. PMI_390]